MATVSFDKNIVINEPDAVSKLVDSLINDKGLKIDKQLVSPYETAKGEQKLRQYLSHFKN